MTADDVSHDDTPGTQPFNIDMDIPTTLPQGRGGFVPASTIETPVQVKRSTFLVQMPLLLSRGILIKRLATILLPRHKNIAFLPHTSSTHDKITDHELIPIDDMGISHYIFDEKTSVRNRGNRNKYKMIECKLQVESPISLYHIKGANEVMALLKKHDIYITAKSYCQAVSTKAIGLLMNLDTKRSAKNRIIELLKEQVDIQGESDVFVDLVPHRGLVRIGKKVIYGQFLKVMVDVKHATLAAKVIQDGLKNAKFGTGLQNVRLMPVYPIPNLMSAEMFGKMIIAHNDSMYGIACHLVFTVKFDLTRKSRYVAGGHLAPSIPKFMTYSSVVSRESVRIAFTLAALNDLEVLAGDVSHAYLHAKTKEKIWFRTGGEFGVRAGRRVKVVRALYGLPSSGNAWRAQLSDTLRNHLGYKSCLADPDIWIKKQTKANGEQYYAYILCYVDDLLIVHETPHKDMEKIKSTYPVAQKSIGPPKVYLGANFQKLKSNTVNKECWGASAEQYVREAVRNVKARLKQDGFIFNKKLSYVNYSPSSPFSNKQYRPELDTTLECNALQTNFFQNLLGVLRWIIELGRIDINFEVAVLSQYLVNPRLGHLQQALHIFKYLDIHKENFIAFDPTPLIIEEPSNRLESAEQRAIQMKEFYLDAQEAIPPNAPLPLGKPLQINCFVDADHAGNAVTRKSHTGVLLFLNMAPISWYSKRQNTVESSTYSSEFIALKTAVEQTIALRYKLRMMGVPLEGAARVFCDNEAVYKNASEATSTLKRKHQSIAYHLTRDSVAASIIVVYKVLKQ